MEAIELTLQDGNLATINTALVTYFRPCDDGTAIFLVAGGCITVTESYDAVAELFNPERQEGC